MLMILPPIDSISLFLSLLTSVRRIFRRALMQSRRLLPLAADVSPCHDAEPLSIFAFAQSFRRRLADGFAITRRHDSPLCRLFSSCIISLFIFIFLLRHFLPPDFRFDFQLLSFSFFAFMIFSLRRFLPFSIILFLHFAIIDYISLIIFSHVATLIIDY
jgi:hypothetical protein